MHEVGLVPPGVMIGDNIEMLFRGERWESVWSVFFCLMTRTSL
jgi:hypothetical protein